MQQRAWRSLRIVIVREEERGCHGGWGLQRDHRPDGLEQLEGRFLHQKAALSCAWAQALIYQSQPRTAESRMTMGLATPRPLRRGWHAS